MGLWVIIVLSFFFLGLMSSGAIEPNMNIDSAVFGQAASSLAVILVMSGLLMLRNLEKRYKIVMYILIVLAVWVLSTLVNDLYMCYLYYFQGGNSFG